MLQNKKLKRNFKHAEKVNKSTLNFQYKNLFISVRCVNIIQTSNNGTSAAVIYDQVSDAQNAVVRLTNEFWNGRTLIVSPSYNRTSAHNSSQNCKLQVRWFLTESDCQGKITFTEKESADEALKLIKNKFQCECKLQINSINPAIRCQWLLQAHNGQAFIDFDTNVHAEEYVSRKRIDTMQILLSKTKNTSILVRNIPPEYDEEDLREKFPNSKAIKLQYTTKINQIENLDNIKENTRRIFNHYRSFVADKTEVQPQPNYGKVEVRVEFTDENEAKAAIQEMNGRTGYINTGKIRLSLINQIQNKKSPQNQNEYIVKLSKLPPHIVEDDLHNELKQNNLADNLSYIFIVRKKLNAATNTNKINFELQSELQKLRNLFSSRKYFRSEPEVDIRPATDDGRVTAMIIYNNSDDVTTAMNLYKDPLRKNLYQFDQYKLYLTPHNDHVIELNPSLVKAIPQKIEQALDDIRRMNLLNVNVFKKEINKNERKITRIHIQGSDNLELAKARAVFDRLMKGLEFRFNDPSWVS
jgi:RNA recognition motif-containing protein